MDRSLCAGPPHETIYKGPDPAGQAVQFTRAFEAPLTPGDQLPLRSCYFRCRADANKSMDLCVAFWCRRELQPWLLGKGGRNFRQIFHHHKVKVRMEKPEWKKQNTISSDNLMDSPGTPKPAGKRIDKPFEGPSHNKFGEEMCWIAVHAKSLAQAVNVSRRLWRVATQFYAIQATLEK